MSREHVPTALRRKLGTNAANKLQRYFKNVSSTKRPRVALLAKLLRLRTSTFRIAARFAPLGKLAHRFRPRGIASVKDTHSLTTRTRAIPQALGLVAFGKVRYHRPREFSNASEKVSAEVTFACRLWRLETKGIVTSWWREACGRINRFFGAPSRKVGNEIWNTQDFPHCIQTTLC